MSDDDAAVEAADAREATRSGGTFAGKYLSEPYRPVKVGVEVGLGDVGERDAEGAPRAVATVKFGEARLYVYESLDQPGVMVVDLDDGEAQPGGIRLFAGGSTAPVYEAEFPADEQDGGGA